MSQTNGPKSCQEKLWPLPSSLTVRIENKYPAQILTGTLLHAAAVRELPALLLQRTAVGVQDMAWVLGYRDTPGWDPLTRNDMTRDLTLDACPSQKGRKITVSDLRGLAYLTAWTCSSTSWRGFLPLLTKFGPQCLETLGPQGETCHHSVELTSPISMPIFF